MKPTRSSVCLALNGALLMVAGLLVGAAVQAVPYPRLMLAAHIGFTGSGTISILAALLLSSSLSSVSNRAAGVIVWCHVLLWPLGFSEIAAAFWGTNQALRIAGAQAGATGGAPWQEGIVTACHAVPALALLIAWLLLTAGIWRVLRERA